ncbi:MAG TPA: dodecin domain-containing protein [Polyangiaceae bacterium]
MSLCKEIEAVGVSSESWERAAAVAVKSAVESLADRCIIRRVNDNTLSTPTFETEVVKFDFTLNADGSIHKYRARVRVSLVYGLGSSRSFAPPPISVFGCRRGGP